MKCAIKNKTNIQQENYFRQKAGSKHYVSVRPNLNTVCGKKTLFTTELIWTVSTTIHERKTFFCHVWLLELCSATTVFHAWELDFCRVLIQQWLPMIPLMLIFAFFILTIRMLYRFNPR